MVLQLGADDASLSPPHATHGLQLTAIAEVKLHVHRSQGASSMLFSCSGRAACGGARRIL